MVGRIAEERTAVLSEINTLIVVKRVSTDERKAF